VQRVAVGVRQCSRICFVEPRKGTIWAPSSSCHVTPAFQVKRQTDHHSWDGLLHHACTTTMMATARAPLRIVKALAVIAIFSTLPTLPSSAMAFQRAGFLSRRVLLASSSRGRSRIIGSSSPSWSALLASLQEEVDPGKVDGTDLRIVKYPHPSLRRENGEVTPEELQDGSIAQIAKEMFLVMYAAEGIGLAAPQVGINKRLMIFNESGDKKKWLDEAVLVNPRIVESSEATEVLGEACLSFPDMDGDVLRPKWVKVEALTAKGKKVKKKYTGFTARLFQHEYDHLDGVVYIDRLTEEGRKAIQPKLDALVQEFGEGGAL
jgi:peptide deformylase